VLLKAWTEAEQKTEKSVRERESGRIQATSSAISKPRRDAHRSNCHGPGEFAPNSDQKHLGVALNKGTKHQQLEPEPHNLQNFGGFSRRTPEPRRPQPARAAHRRGACTAAQPQWAGGRRPEQP
jgi:hypothetical protein